MAGSAASMMLKEKIGYTKYPVYFQFDVNMWEKVLLSEVSIYLNQKRFIYCFKFKNAVSQKLL